MTTPEEALRPCPFCGGRSIILRHSSRYMTCDACGADGPMTATAAEDAKSAWNRRATLSTPAMEPVAWMFQHDETGRMAFCANDGVNTVASFVAANPRLLYVAALYPRAAPQGAMRDAFVARSFDVGIKQAVEELQATAPQGALASSPSNALGASASPTALSAPQGSAPIAGAHCDERSLRDRIIEGELMLDGTHPPTLMLLMAEHWLGVANEFRAKAKDYDRLKHELRLARIGLREGSSPTGRVPEGPSAEHAEPGGDSHAPKDNGTRPDEPMGAQGVPAGWRLAPGYRGYAALGTGAYLLDNSAAGDPAELIISIATDDEKDGREVGSVMDNKPGREIHHEDMAVRLRFVSVAGLDALEQQLRFLREEHFPALAAAPAAPAPRPNHPAIPDGSPAPQVPAEPPMPIPNEHRESDEFNSDYTFKYHDPSQMRAYGDAWRTIVQRLLRQLDAWQRKYGEHDPKWLPPAGDVQVAEDAGELLAADLHRSISAAIAPSAAPPAAPQVEPAARALEFAEYMAKGAEQFIDATDHAAMKRAAADGAPHDAHRPLLCDQADIAESDSVEALRRLRSYIYEFRKRAALAAPPSQPKEPKP